MFVYYYIVDLIYFIYHYYLCIHYKKIPLRYSNNKFNEKNPIILLQGVGDTWAALLNLGDYLLSKGYPVYFVKELGENKLPIPQSSEIVHKFIEQKGLRNIILIGHSKGGLSAKYILAYLNKDKRVLGSVSIATPYQGSILAFLARSASYKELKPSSEIIMKLQTEEKVNAKIISIYPSFDTAVWGKNKSLLKGAMENIKIKSFGHIKPIYTKELFGVVTKSIEKFSAVKS